MTKLVRYARSLSRASWISFSVAVSTEAAGRGLAKRMVEAAKQQARARGVQRTALVSVQGSQHYWERQGYKVEPVTNAAQQQHLASYGEGALYMVGFI